MAQLQQGLMGPGAGFAAAPVAQTSDYARARFIPSLASARVLTKVLGRADTLEVLWNKPYACNPQNRAPVPADQHMDLQTFFFGPMSHSLTVRPRRPEEGCCSACAPFRFDVAADMFSPPFAAGEITNSMCACGHDVTVNFPNGPLKGTISNACCGAQPRVNFDWVTGENMSYRLPPHGCCVPCGPYRTGFVGTAPGEEEKNEIRYWDHDGMFVSCRCPPCCNCGCDECCPDKHFYGSWNPISLYGMQQRLQAEYSFSLMSVFGEPSTEWNAEFLPAGTNAGAYPTDINGLGNWRLGMHKDACCKWKFSDAHDVIDLAHATAMDMTFRGSYNQNHLDQRDFHLVLAYLIMQSFNFLKKGGGNHGIKLGMPRPWLGREQLALPHPAMQMNKMV